MENVGGLELGKREGFNKGLDVGVDVSRDVFSRGTIRRDEVAEVAKFVYLKKYI